MNEATFRRETYNTRGDYHASLDPNWNYYPTYLAKMRYVEGILDNISLEKKILDVGCGEGVTVTRYQEKGYKIWGVDYNYGSAVVIPGSAMQLPFANESIDVVMFMDVIEHLFYPDQEIALQNIHRVLAPGGMLILSAPNLAHLMSRLKFVLFGRLGRTAKVSKHPGDRPIGEYLDMLNRCGFKIMKRYGITLTVPLLTTHLIWKKPQKYLWLHRWLDVIQLPNLAFVNVVICRKKD